MIRVGDTWYSDDKLEEEVKALRLQLSEVRIQRDQFQEQLSKVKRALYDECTGQSCGEGCEGGYRACVGCDRRAKMAHGIGWGK